MSTRGRSDLRAPRDDWQLFPIREVALGLYDGPHATPAPSEDGPVFLGIKNITEDGRLDLSGVRHIAEEEFGRWTRRVLPRKDDIVFSYEATLNRYALIPDGLRCCLGRRMALVRVDTRKVDPHFLYYYFFSDEWRGVIKKNTIVGATVDRIPIADFPEFPVRLPRLDEQKRIASVLSALGAKITLNQRVNAELEAMAKLLYDYWFVQFDFPNAQGKPYKSSGGRMVYNAQLKREVPEGWEVKNLNEISEVIMGQSPLSTSYNTEGIGLPLVNGAADYRNGQIAPETYTSTPTRTAIKDDLVFCSRATIGNLTIAEHTYCIGRCISAVRPNKAEYLELLYFGLEYEIERFIRQAPGSIIKGITKDDLHEAKFLTPPGDVLKAFHAATGPQFQLIRNNRKQNQELTALRDWLLPLLMNGQVSVGAAAERVGLAMAAEGQGVYGKSAPRTFTLEDRAVLNAWVVHVSNKDHRLGRTKAEKIEHILEGHLGNDHQREAVRDAAGPIDIKSRKQVEALMQQRQWGLVEEKELKGGKTMFQYHSGPRVTDAVSRAEALLGGQLTEANRIVRLMKPLRTERCEVVATLYAAWNDLLFHAKPATDKDIFIAASADWHEHKMDIEFSEWLWGLKWLRENGIIPTGASKPVKAKKGN